MRLIDADKFRRFAHEQLEGNKTYSIDEILEMIDEQPTAFDKNEVMKELKEYAEGDMCDNYKHCPYIDNPDIHCENCGALGTLDIVNRGGIK